MNGVNGGDTVFVHCVCVCAACARSGLVNSISKIVKATDFEFNVHVSMDSPVMPP